MNNGKLISVVFEIGRECLLQMQSVSLGADISQGDFIVIDLLEIGEKLSCNDLAVKMSLSVSRSSRIVDRLVRKGYVLRKANPKDRRAVQVSLSAKGIRLKKNIDKLKTQCEKQIFGAMDTKDFEAVKHGILILSKALKINEQTVCGQRKITPVLSEAETKK
jgi:DNA-binding MarR family transcriptional regulator